MSGRLVHTSPYLLLVVATLSWSGNWVVGRALAGTVPPVALSFWRWALATLILLPWAWPHLRRGWPVLRTRWPVLVLLGTTGTAVFNGLCYVGMQYTTATNGLLLQSVVPMMVIGVTALFFGQRLTPVQLAGVVVSLAGVVCIVSHGELATLLGLSLNRGDVWVLVALVFWAAYTVALRWRPADLHAIAFLAVLAGTGAAVMAPFYALEWWGGARIHLTPAALGGLAYVAVFPSILSFVCWNAALPRVGPEKSSLFLHLMPVFGSILSMIFLGERLHLYHLAGMALIFSGIALTTDLRRMLGRTSR